MTKRYRGQAEAAVDALTLDVRPRELLVMVGPSGCGKTTTLRLINRLLDADEGWITVDGQDTARLDADSLRTRIGYVIQQVGLFPHMTVADNVATVPRVLGWDRARIARRVDDLLELLGLDPADFRDRFPRELSGGQAQRVGVARAMAADPPILLMDEPFGSLDPITRARLQDELLRVQGSVAKTILLVTHDIDEAIKLGDRIAVVDRGARVLQVDRPGRVLSDPADDYVREFVGSGAALRRLGLIRVGEVEPGRWPALPRAAERHIVRDELIASGRPAALLLDEGRRPWRWVTARDLERGGEPGTERGVPASTELTPEATLHEALDAIVRGGIGAAAAVDHAGALHAIVDLEAIMAAADPSRQVERTARGEEAGLVLS
ncbi:MAG TPA: ABC transporter ATP-binding protein [Thermoleophilaceae bacterium]|nr:ABC transporter ATP-binding protein [Thermoleophilaceae bacterium]